MRLWNPQELQGIRVFDDADGMFGHVTFIGKSQHTVLVAALEQVFKEQGVDLSFKLPLVPVVPSGFLFIELPCLLVLDAHQRAIVRSTQIGMKAGCGLDARWWLFWCQIFAPCVEFFALAQFSTHRGENGCGAANIRLIEFPHIPQGGGGEALAIALRQPL